MTIKGLLSISNETKLVFALIENVNFKPIRHRTEQKLKRYKKIKLIWMKRMRVRMTKFFTIILFIESLPSRSLDFLYEAMLYV